MSSEEFIPVFIDAKPAENLEPSTEQTLCFVGILSSSMDGVPKLKGYKTTQRRRKMDAALRIIDCLQNKDFEVDAVGVASKTNGQFVHWACDTINRARDAISAEWEIEGSTPTYLKWNGHRLPRSTVLGLSTYASVLPILALRAECLASGDPTKTFKLCLDALPHNSQIGMDLMKALRIEPAIAQMWKENMERGVHFEVGVFGRWMNTEGKWRKAKIHPNMILVDWFAASCLAKVDPNQLKSEGNYSDGEIETIAGIWDAAVRPTSTSILDLDDSYLRQRVKDHMEQA